MKSFLFCDLLKTECKLVITQGKSLSFSVFIFPLPPPPFSLPVLLMLLLLPLPISVISAKAELHLSLKQGTCPPTTNRSFLDHCTQQPPVFLCPWTICSSFSSISKFYLCCYKLFFILMNFFEFSKLEIISPVNSWHCFCTSLKTFQTLYLLFICVSDILWWTVSAWRSGFMSGPFCIS